jgi:hypothetical protein
MLRKLAPLAALVFLAGCPEEIGVQCPPGTSSVGQFTLGFAGQHPAGECVAVSVDGGDAGIGPLALQDGGVQSGNVCFGPPDDAGQQLTLVIPGKSPRPGFLLDGGRFDFTADNKDAGPTNTTACVCPVSVVESFTGTLVGLTPDGSFAAPDDGGLPVAASLNGTLKDTLTAGTAADPTCICAMPCTVTYTITGTR